MTKDELLELVHEIERDGVVKPQGGDVSRETEELEPTETESSEAEAPAPELETEVPEQTQLSLDEVKTILAEIFKQKTLTDKPVELSDADAYLENPDSMTSRLLKSYGMEKN